MQRDMSCSKIIREVGEEIRAVPEIYERFGHQAVIEDTRDWTEWTCRENYHALACSMARSMPLTN